MTFSLPHVARCAEMVEESSQRGQGCCFTCRKSEHSSKNFQCQKVSPVYLGNEDPGKYSPQFKFSRPLKSKIKNTLNHAEVFASLLLKLEQNRNHRNQGAFTLLITLLNNYSLSTAAIKHTSSTPLKRSH